MSVKIHEPVLTLIVIHMHPSMILFHNLIQDRRMYFSRDDLKRFTKKSET